MATTEHDTRSSAGAAREPEALRRYRFLLQTAEPASLIALHAAALSRLSPSGRSEVLRAVRVGLVAGLRISAEHFGAIARIAVLGEKRQPGVVRRALAADTLEALATEVANGASMTTLFEGYERWDGLEPAPPRDPEPAPDFHSRWHDARINPGATWGIAYVGGLSTPRSTAGPERGCALQSLRPQRRPG